MSEKADAELDADERRTENDRRDFKSALSDSSIVVDELAICKDRRKMPERRLNNISVEETEIVEEEFLEYLNNYKKQVK